MFEILFSFTLITAFVGLTLWLRVWLLPRLRRSWAHDRPDRELVRPEGPAPALHAPSGTERAIPPNAGFRRPGVGQFDIAPGESRMANGRRDVVLEASMQSFPASDPPGIY